MKNEEEPEKEQEQEVEVEVDASATSTPSTPPSPLPVSVGPGNQRYAFSASSASSSHVSTEELPLLQDKVEAVVVVADSPFSAFSLDWPPEPSQRPASRSSCLKDLLEWFVLRCCSCCSWNLTPSQLIKPHEN
ncbi:hypothetical protein Droror1_Dr00007640 [Drosera rotundifolia]